MGICKTIWEKCLCCSKEMRTKRYRTIVNRLRLDKLEVIRTTKYSTKTHNKIENPGVICFSCITKSYSNLDEKQNIKEPPMSIDRTILDNHDSLKCAVCLKDVGKKKKTERRAMSDDVMKIEAANKLCMKNWDENGFNHNDFIRLVKVDDYLCITCNHKVNTERLLLIKLKENNSIHLLADNLLSESHTESKITEIDWISID